jgi:hypothetical protein
MFTAQPGLEANKPILYTLHLTHREKPRTENTIIACIVRGIYNDLCGLTRCHNCITLRTDLTTSYKTKSHEHRRADGASFTWKNMAIADPAPITMNIIE